MSAGPCGCRGCALLPGACTGEPPDAVQLHLLASFTFVTDALCKTDDGFITLGTRARSA